MGCISANTYKVGACISASAYRVGGISASAYRVGSGVGADVHRIGGISVTVGLICTNNNRKYVIVEPTEVQWVTEAIDATYFITSNTDWMIT